MQLSLKSITTRIPEFCLSHWLLRVPLAIVFIQQGLSKFPVTADDAEADKVTVNLEESHLVSVEVQSRSLQRCRV